MSKIDKSNLAYMGDAFQYNAVKALIEEPDFLASMERVIDQNLFSHAVLRRVVCIAIDLYRELGYTPSYTEIENKIREKERDTDELDYTLQYLNEIKRLPSKGIASVRDQLGTYMRWRRGLALAKRYLNNAEFGYDEKLESEIAKGFTDLSIFGQDESITTTLTPELEYRVLSQSQDEQVPTFIQGIDEAIGGGNQLGDIGLFTAPTGAGKTTFASIISYNASVNGYKVLMVYFEDNVVDIARKIMAQLSKEVTSNLRALSPEQSQKGVDKLEQLANTPLVREHLLMCKMPEKKTTVEDIERKLIELRNTRDFTPRLLVIDYFSCLKYSARGYDNDWSVQADCMKKLKALALKYNIAIWVMQQTNRSGARNDGDADMGNWQGSYEATQPSSIWIELRRTREQRQEKRADIIFHKTRHSLPLGNFKDIIFDNGHLTIDCSTSLEDPLVYNENTLEE